MSDETTVHLRILEDIKENIGVVASLLFTEEKDGFHVIHSPHSCYHGQIALLVTTARLVFSEANTTGHAIGNVAELLAMEPVYIHWGNAPSSPKQYAFVLGWGQIGSEGDIVDVLAKVLVGAEDYWQRMRGATQHPTTAMRHISYPIHGPCVTCDLMLPAEQEHQNEEQEHCMEAEDIAEAELPELVADSDDEEEEKEAGELPIH